MATSMGKQHDCSKCGAKIVKAVSKAGKTYTASVYVWEGDMGGKRAFLPVHTCDENEIIRWTAAKEYDLANGKLVIGQHITVIKGRKVAKGTQGIVFWFQCDDYGKTIRLGFKDSDETVFWIDAKNVEATVKVGA